MTKNNQSMFKNNHELILGEGLTCFQFQQISESFNFNTPANPELVFCWT